MAASMKMKILIFIGSLMTASCQVLELDDRFLSVYKEGMWMVEFYAPWCGHCKKLEPIYHQVYYSLRKSAVKVAKIDATRFSSVASEFGVKGFPTIKFFNGEKIYTHKGERSKEDLLQFAARAQGPAVKMLASTGKYNEVASLHSNTVYFLYVGNPDPVEDLFTKYTAVAENLIIQTYFYAGKQIILPGNVKPSSSPAVLAFKDGKYYEYKPVDGVFTMKSLEDWVNSERFPAFPKVTGSNINDMAETGKILVITVINPQDTENKDLQNKVKKISADLAIQQRERFHSKFQFLWMTDTETVNSITMSFLTAPVIVILDTTSHYYYYPTTPVDKLTSTILADYLEGVREGKVTAYGGTSFIQRLKRVFYDLVVMIVGVWQTSRWLFLLMFGLPTAVISIVCYSLCCMETVDDDLPDSEDEDEEERREFQQEDEDQPESMRRRVKSEELSDKPEAEEAPTSADDHIKSE